MILGERENNEDMRTVGPVANWNIPPIKTFILKVLFL